MLLLLFHLIILDFFFQVKSIDEFCFDDFELVNYQCNKKISMKMAV